MGNCIFTHPGPDPNAPNPDDEEEEVKEQRDEELRSKKARESALSNLMTSRRMSIEKSSVPARVELSRRQSVEYNNYNNSSNNAIDDASSSSASSTTGSYLRRSDSLNQLGPSLQRGDSMNSLGGGWVETIDLDCHNEKRGSGVVGDQIIGGIPMLSRQTSMEIRRDNVVKKFRDADKIGSWVMLDHKNDAIYDEFEMAKMSKLFEAIMKIPNMTQIERENDSAAKSLEELTAEDPESNNLIQIERTNSQFRWEIKGKDVKDDSSGLIQITRSDTKSKLQRLHTGNIMIGPSIKPGAAATTRSNVTAASFADLGLTINGKEMDLSSGRLVDLAIVRKMIYHYKTGGHLSIDAVHKILKLAYRILQQAPNINKVTISVNARVTVVGDLHGQLPDLLYILEEAGMPSEKQKYVFNGDFIDRGPCGVEVMCIIYSLLIACPNYVFLNRGNHEEKSISKIYGFFRECERKFHDSEVTYHMFIETFKWLPLFTIINNDVFIVHGGLFRSQDVTLADLRKINRSNFTLERDDDEKPGDIPIAPPRENEREFLMSLQIDALWSDPRKVELVEKSSPTSSPSVKNPPQKSSASSDDIHYSSRGTGVIFGAQTTKTFLDNNDLKFVVRSHEIVWDESIKNHAPFDLPFEHSDVCLRDESDTSAGGELLCTLFSASNYSNYGNAGAYMNFFFKNSPLSTAIPASMKHSIRRSDLEYDVHYYFVKSDDHILDNYEYYNDDDSMSICSDDTIPAGSGNELLCIQELILKKKQVLLTAFQKACGNTKHKNRNVIDAAGWAKVMEHTLKIHLPWSNLMVKLVKDSHCQPFNGKTGDKGINYKTFLDSFSVQLDLGSLTSSNTHVDQNVVESIYTHQKELELVFQFFDKDESGKISRDEFKSGCEVLNQQLPAEDQIQAPDELLDLLDLNKNGEIDINLFFEMFRLTQQGTNKSQQQLHQGTPPRSPSGSFDVRDDVSTTSESSSRSPSIDMNASSSDDDNYSQLHHEDKGAMGSSGPLEISISSRLQSQSTDDLLLMSGSIKDFPIEDADNMPLGSDSSDSSRLLNGSFPPTPPPPPDTDKEDI